MALKQKKAPPAAAGHPPCGGSSLIDHPRASRPATSTAAAR